MTYRELTEEEKRISSKNLELIEDELEYDEQVILPKKQFAISTADIEFKKQLKDLKREEKALIAKISEMKNAITTIKEQVENGVELKEKSIEKEEELQNE